MRDSSKYLQRGAGAALALAIALALPACGGAASSSSTAASSEATASIADSSSAGSEVASAAADTSSVEGGTTSSTSASDADQTAADIAAKRAELRAQAEKEGLSVYEGTVRMMSGPELCEYEQVDPVALGLEGRYDDATFAILVLDDTTHIVGMGGDATPGVEKDDDHIAIGRDEPRYEKVEDSASAWKAYDGMRVCVAGTIWFPSDVSLPPAPRMYDAKMLYFDE